MAYQTWADYMREHGEEEYSAWDKAVTVEMEKGHTEQCAAYNLACAPWDEECICERKSY